MFAFPPPAIPGIGTRAASAVAAGPQRRHGRLPRPERAEFLEAARKRPELQNVNPPSARGAAGLRRRRPRQGAEAGRADRRGLPDLAGVPRRLLRQRLQPLRPAVAGLRPGRGGSERTRPEDIGQFYVRNNDGKMVPLSALAHDPDHHGTRVHAALQPVPGRRRSPARAAPGYSSGQALDALEEVAQQTLPREMGYDWTDLSYQEKKAAGTTGRVFALSIALRLPDPGRPVRELVAALQRPALGAGGGVRRLPRAAGCGSSTSTSSARSGW